MSGSSLAFWAFDRQPKVSAEAIATRLQCISDDSRVFCLQNATVVAIKKAFLQYAESMLRAGTGIGISGGSPSVQTAGQVVLQDLPENILLRKNFNAVPMLTGITRHEGTYATSVLGNGYILPNKLENDGTFFEYNLIHVVLKILNVDDPAGFVADSALGHFFDRSTLGNPTAMQDGMIDLSGAYSFKSPCRAHALYVANAGQPAFVYSFAQYAPGTNTDMGITHGAEQFYLFPNSQVTDELSSDDVTMRNTLLALVTNFVIFQNPTPSDSAVPDVPQWELFEQGAEHFMDLQVPCTLRRNFSQELTAARREHFSESIAHRVNGGATSPEPATTPRSRTPSVAASMSLAVLGALAASAAHRTP